jgi:hypothetical protein
MKQTKAVGMICSSEADTIAGTNGENRLGASVIQVELFNVREYVHETGTYLVDVLRFLDGFPAENEFMLLHSTSNGTLLRDSTPVIPNKRYRIRCGSEKIQNGDVMRGRLLTR